MHPVVSQRGFAKWSARRFGGDRHHGAAREAAMGLFSFLSLGGTLLVFNAIGVPPWLLVPSALTLAVVVGFLLGARGSERSS